jgi:hypothetical protein
MLLWLESQPTPVIALLVFALCYLLAAIVFFAVATISRRPIAQQLSATTPVMLTPLAVIAALLIAFLASRVWSNVDRANTYIAQEASAIRQSVLLADTLPDDTRTAVRDALRSTFDSSSRTIGRRWLRVARTCVGYLPGSRLR